MDSSSGLALTSSRCTFELSPPQFTQDPENHAPPTKKLTPSTILLNRPNSRLNGQITIAKIGDEFVQDFELSRNLDLAKRNKAGPTCMQIQQWNVAKGVFTQVASNIKELDANLYRV